MRGGGKGGSNCGGGGVCAEVNRLNFKRSKEKQGDGAIKNKQMRRRGKGGPNFGRFLIKK